MIAESAVTTESAVPGDGSRNNQAEWVVERGLTWSTDDIVGIRKVNNDHLVRLIDSFAPAGISSGLQEHPARRGAVCSRSRAPAHTQMKWSDSRVRDWKLIEAGWIPSAVSYTDSSVTVAEAVYVFHITAWGWD